MKKIAKHGRQAIIVVPSFLIDELKPGTLTQLTIDVIDNSSVEDKFESGAKK